MDVLHLGFEDPHMTGAGGGSVRTHEINRRLVAEGHRVTVLTTTHPDAVDRWRDGVRYVPVGFGRGRTRLSRLLGYVLLLPWEVLRRRKSIDLVVEDFFAPFSTMAAPLWTRRPTLGVVQWLHAKQKARQYGLPLHLLERVGVRTHTRLIAVSAGTAESLHQYNPHAHVDVIGNGIDPQALTVRPELGRDIVFVGRLELPGKGLDLLVEAWSQSAGEVEGDLVIVGSGPDEQLVRNLVVDHDIADRVRFTGWLSGMQKFQLLSAARLAVVPSREETFGLVALEALATGTPVIAFDIPCLREVVPAGTGWVAPPFDTSALAALMTSKYNRPEDLNRAAEKGRRFASTFNWDDLAAQQARAYQGALDAQARLPRRKTAVSTRGVRL